MNYLVKKKEEYSLISRFNKLFNIKKHCTIKEVPFLEIMIIYLLTNENKSKWKILLKT